MKFLCWIVTAYSWEQRKLGEFTERVLEKNAVLSEKETFTNSAEYGIISQKDFFDYEYITYVRK